MAINEAAAAPPMNGNGFNRWRLIVTAVMVIVICTTGSIHEIFLVDEPRPEILWPCLAGLGILPILPTRGDK